ncbi:MAG TPA: TlpA disulfide reductase family protein, partial [Steroidobacteraceae bacterium]|nr:TlpA disulfide reductase family protein [Steroidobacteraceae bacterium]
MSARKFIKGLALAAVFALPAFAASTSSGPAPAFQLSGRGGKAIDLSQFKGQVVMINFWATWCGPCRQEMPLLEDIYKKYKPMGFTLVGVNVEPDAKDAEAWLGKLSKPVT